MQTYSIKWFSLGFWLIQLPWMFISSYTAIYFFLKSIFSNVYISVNTIFKWCYLFFVWEIDHPLSKYATGVMGGKVGVIKNVYRCVQVAYLLNGLPQNNYVEYFLSIASAKYTRASPPARKMSLFSSIIITIILSYAIIRI